MAVQLITSIVTWQGLSNDTKPTGADVPLGSKFYELNTGKKFIWDGTSWVDDISLIYALSQIV